MRRVVARIGRAHGLRGEVTVEVRTDDPDERFGIGEQLFVVGSADRLTVAGRHWHSGTLLLAFDEVGDRTGAEALRGTVLEAEIDPSGEDDAWYDDQLVGLRVESPEGVLLGTVSALLSGAAQDLLTVRRPDGVERLVPFVTALVPVVDVAAGRLVVLDPGGLISDLEDTGEAHAEGDTKARDTEARDTGAGSGD